MSNFAMVADVVNTRVHGYVKNYSIEKEGIDPSDSTLYKVSIKANVVTAPDGGDDEGLTSFLGLIGKPKVLFLVADKQGNSQMSSVESYLADDFRKSGYQVMTADDVKLKKGITQELVNQARAGHGEASARVARSVNADIVLTGLINLQMTAMNGGTDVSASIGNVNLNVKAIIPGNGNVIDVVNARDRFMSVQQSSEMIAREKAFKKASKKIAQNMKWKIPKYLSQQPRQIQLDVHSLPFQDIETISKFLTKISGIDGVELEDWNEDKAQFIVDASYTGPKEMNIIESLKGRFNALKVKSYRNYHIAVAM